MCGLCSSSRGVCLAGTENALGNPSACHWPWLSPHPLTPGSLPQSFLILWVPSQPPLGPIRVFLHGQLPHSYPAHSPSMASIAPRTSSRPPSLVFEDLWNLKSSNVLTLTSANSTIHLHPTALGVPRTPTTSQLLCLAHAVPFAGEFPSILP